MSPYLFLICTLKVVSGLEVLNRRSEDSEDACSNFGEDLCENDDSCVWGEAKCMTAGVNHHLSYFVSSVFSSLGSLFVVVTFIRWKKYRKHPASLILGRCIFDLIFAVIFLVLYVGDDIHRECESYTPLMIFCLLGSNVYFIATSQNLLLSMKNPFRSVTAYVVRSHIVVWVFAIITLCAVSSLDIAEYRYDLQICWIRSDSTGYTWLFVHLPIIMGILHAYYVLFITWQRMKDGLNQTLDFRRAFLNKSVVYTVAYSIYWLFAWFCYMLLLSSTEDNSSMYWLFACVIALVGIVDGGAWLFTISRQLPPEQNVNSALRKEVLEHTMYGIYTCVQQAKKLPKSDGLPPEVMYVKDMNENPASTTAINRVLSEPKGKQPEKARQFLPIFNYKRETYINDYAPQVFRYIRMDVCGTSDKSYSESFYTLDKSESMAREQYSEGRSGSFFYFTCDSRFMVKTISSGEAKFLIEILDEYVQFLSNNPGSLISRILGLHSLEIYDLKLYFVVMENIFKAEMYPQEKYDIKGSWVDRHTSYKIAQGKVMKDNDLHMKSERGVIILGKLEAEKLLNQLEQDSKFLARLGIMDYSLLIGIYYVKIVSKEVTNDLPSPSLRIISSATSRKTVDSRTTRTNFQTKVGIKFAGLTAADGYQAMADQVVRIQNTLEHIRQNHGGEVEDADDYLPEHVYKQVQELEQLKSIYSSIIKEDYEEPLKYSLVSDQGGLMAIDTEEIFKRGENNELNKTSFSLREDLPVLQHPSKSPWSNYRGGVKARVTEGPGIYYLGIIDMLQEWNFKKKGERCLKTTFLRKDGDGLSAIEPNKYQERFMKRMYGIIKSDESFLTANKVDLKLFQEKAFEMFIWPTPDKVEDNLAEARQPGSSNAERKLSHGEPSVQTRLYERPRNKSTPEKRKNNFQKFSNKLIKSKSETPSKKRIGVNEVEISVL